MRESTAWKILAEEHDARRTDYRCLCDNLRNTSVSLANIPRPVRDAMRERIADAIGDAYVAAYPYVLEINPDREQLLQEQREARVLACLMFAEQARDEERA